MDITKITEPKKTLGGKPVKVSNDKNHQKLSDKQKAMGSLHGRTSYYSQELRCTFYVKAGKDPLEVEQRYLKRDTDRYNQN